MAGQQHHQPVDAHAQAAGGGHPILKGQEKVFVKPVDLIVLKIPAYLLLLLKPGALHRWVVQLGVRIGDLHPGGKCFKPLHVSGSAGLGLGQRRHDLRIIHEEGWLYQVGLHEAGYELVDQPSTAFPGTDLQPQLGDPFRERGVVGKGIQVDSNAV